MDTMQKTHILQAVEIKIWTHYDTSWSFRKVRPSSSTGVLAW